MHTPAMADYLAKHWLFITALYKLFKAKDHTKHFRIEHWGSFLESIKLLGHSGERFFLCLLIEIMCMCRHAIPSLF